MYRTYYTIREFAAELGVSVKTVRRRIADGTISVTRIGGTQRISHNELTMLEMGWVGPGRNRVQRKKAEPCSS